VVELHADAVDRNASGFEFAHHFGNGLPAGGGMDAVVEVKQLGVGIRFMGPLKAFGDEVFDGAPD